MTNRFAKLWNEYQGLTLFVVLMVVFRDYDRHYLPGMDRFFHAL